jgi:hypothetical protein
MSRFRIASTVVTGAIIPVTVETIRLTASNECHGDFSPITLVREFYRCDDQLVELSFGRSFHIERQDIAVSKG